MTLPVVELDEIRAAATRDVVFGSVRNALIAHSEGRTLVPPPIHLAFADVGGDCHVKAGHLIGSPHFVVKVAGGFYRNPAAGLPTNNGVMLVMSAMTGAPVAALADEGWLTAWRTAAAGALITDALTPPDVTEVGVLGAGLQARLQVEWLHALRPLSRVNVWGRRPAAAQRLCAALGDVGIKAHSVDRDVAAGTPCVITATASTTPLAPATAFNGAQHITAIGADMPGKNELPPALFGRATTIATDDHTQCLEHGDFGTAIRAGTATPNADTPVGTILRNGEDDRTRPGLSIADLTGVAATDAALATAILQRLNIFPASPAHEQALSARRRPTNGK
jgi:ornithine cyclodeaminase/alanine dehydrogenase-like protein (mu-crystallin family)